MSVQPGSRTDRYVREVQLRRDRVESFETYPFSLPAVRGLEGIPLHPAVTFLIGENGSGKSTLMEAIAVAWGFNPEGGTKNFRFGTRASHSVLHQYLRLVKGVTRPRDGFFLRAESFFNVATEIEHLDANADEHGPLTINSPPVVNYYGGRSLHEQSHGESFFALMLERFGGNGLYVLDEPEAALSPSRQMAMIARIHQLVEKQSQFIIATHSPILLAFPGATIYSCDTIPLSEVKYEELDHVTITRDFLNAPERYLRHLSSS